MNDSGSHALYYWAWEPTIVARLFVSSELFDHPGEFSKGDGCQGLSTA